MSAQRTAALSFACFLAACSLSRTRLNVDDAGIDLNDAALDALPEPDAGGAVDAAILEDAMPVAWDLAGPDASHIADAGASTETPIPCSPSWYETSPEYRGFVHVGDAITIPMTGAAPAQCRMLRVDYARQLDVWIDVPVDSGEYSRVNVVSLRVLEDGGREWVSRGTSYCRACGPVGIRLAEFEPGIYELGFEFVSEWGEAMPTGNIVFNVTEGEEP